MAESYRVGSPWRDDQDGEMRRVLLVLPTSTYRAEDFLAAAAALDVEVSIASEEEAPLVASDRFVRIDCSRPREAAAAVVELATRTPVDAIVSVDDQGVLIGALAAEQLGLPHNPPAAVAATANKVVMRRALEKAEVPQPSFRVIGNHDDPVAEAADLGYPLVAKPLSLSGSRGVIRVDGSEDLVRVVESIRRILAAAGSNPNEPVLIERFASGPEVAVEGILYGGELDVLAVFDKPDQPDGPYFEETIFVTPSRLHPEVLSEVERVTRLACAGLGLVEGPIHAELRVTNGRVRLIEVAARSIGGLCGRALRFGLLDSSLETIILRHALGERHPGLHRRGGASGVMMLPIPRSGTLRAVDGREQALAVTGITGLEVTAPLGSLLRAVPEADRYLGFLFAAGAAPAEVEASLRAAHRCLRVVID